MKTIKHLSMLLAVMFLATLPTSAQNTDNNKNKAIIETNDGSQELNTDDIQLIRFDGGKITVVQPWGDTTFDRTLRTLSFLRPNPGTLHLTATTSIGTEGSGNRATLDLTTQDGTVENLFYFIDDAQVTIDGGNATVPDLSFERPIAVVKFTLKDKGNSDAAISAKSFTVHAGGNTYTVTPESATNMLFVGIPAIDTENVTLTAFDGNEYYLYQKTSVTFTDNKYYATRVHTGDPV